MLVRLLAFSPGAASSRFARAAVLCPAPFCLLVSFALISSRFLFLCDGCGRPFWGYSPFCVTFHILWLGSCFCLVCLVFPLGAASSRSACAAVLRPATYSLLSFSDGSASLASYQPPAVSRIMVGFVQLLAFLLGASSSRSASATVLRPAPFFSLSWLIFTAPSHRSGSYILSRHSWRAPRLHTVLARWFSRLAAFLYAAALGGRPDVVPAHWVERPL